MERKKIKFHYRLLRNKMKWIRILKLFCSSIHIRDKSSCFNLHLCSFTKKWNVSVHAYQLVGNGIKTKNGTLEPRKKSISRNWRNSFSSWPSYFRKKCDNLGWNIFYEWINCINAYFDNVNYALNVKDVKPKTFSQT